MNRESFWDQLKRRNVPRMAAFYAGAAWLLVQVATQVFPFFDVSNRAVRLVVIACIIGFPFALAFSWFYELTPQGLKRESELEADHSIARTPGRKLDRWIFVVLALAVVVLAARLLSGGDDHTGAAPQAPAAPAAPSTAAADKSIAVLPFQSLSGDPDNAYFALGMQDEILTHLSRIGALRVISRTSTARYGAAPEDLPDIARHLGVAHVLEGSVQKAGDTVRINVQLIRADTDEHLWAETYDRKLDNIFGVEGEVAQAIAEALNARLTGDEHRAIGQAPTQVAAAYDLYLRGLTYELRYSSDQDYADAARYYRDAVSADPAFALAWAHLSMVHSYLYLNGREHGAAALEQMRGAAEKAMSLQPNLGEAWLARGYYFYRGLRDFDAAIATFEQARLRLPNNAEVSAAIAYAQRRQGKWDQAMGHLQAAAQRDPQNISYWMGIAEIHGGLRRYAQAQAALDHALVISPDSDNIRAQKAGYYLAAGDLDAAGRIIDTLPAELRFVDQAGTYLLMRRDYARLRHLATDLIANPGKLSGQLAGLYALLGAGYLFDGQRDAALIAFENGRRYALKQQAEGQGTDTLACHLGLLEAGLGHRPAALAAGQHCVELAGEDSIKKPTAQVTQAQIQALAGDRNTALQALPQLLAIPHGLVPGDLRYNPVWDSLRDDPRFEAALAQAGVR